MALDLADHLFAALPELRVHPTAKRIRAFVGGEAVVDSTRALDRVGAPSNRARPTPCRSPTSTARSSRARTRSRPRSGPCTWATDPGARPAGAGSPLHTTPGQAFDIAIDSTTLTGAAFVPADPDLAGYAILDFEAFDEWREEDELLVGHARDPFKTVDTRRSSRRVVVEIAGVIVADSTRSTMLFETYLPTRYYLPREDVRMDLLDPTDTTTVCAYKGSPSTGRRPSAHGGRRRGVELSRNRTTTPPR